MTKVIRFCSQENSREQADRGQKTQVCNCCGRKIPAYPSLDAQEYVEITKRWGYFSGKDCETHRIHICEACYDAWISTFAIAPEVTEDTELM